MGILLARGLFEGKAVYGMNGFETVFGTVFKEQAFPIVVSGFKRLIPIYISNAV